MDTHPHWYDPRFRTHLHNLDAPGLAHEILRHSPAYVAAYRSFRQKFDVMKGIQSRRKLVEQFAHHWGLSCTR